MTTAQLIDGVNPNGEYLEERFHTIVHGTNQYWYLRSEVIGEYGSPIFLHLVVQNIPLQI